MIDKQLTEQFWNLIKRIRDLLGNYHLNLRVTGLEPSYTCIEGSIQLISLIAINSIKNIFYSFYFVPVGSTRNDKE